MARPVIYYRGAFNEFSSVVDAPLLDKALSEKDFISYYRREYGEERLKILIDRLPDIKKNGTSIKDETLKDTVGFNRAGINEKNLSLKKLIKRYLNLKYRRVSAR